MQDLEGLELIVSLKGNYWRPLTRDWMTQLGVDDGGGRAAADVFQAREVPGLPFKSVHLLNLSCLNLALGGSRTSTWKRSRTRPLRAPRSTLCFAAPITISSNPAFVQLFDCGTESFFFFLKEGTTCIKQRGLGEEEKWN